MGQRRVLGQGPGQAHTHRRHLGDLPAPPQTLAFVAEVWRHHTSGAAPLCRVMVHPGAGPTAAAPPLPMAEEGAEAGGEVGVGHAGMPYHTEVAVLAIAAAAAAAGAEASADHHPLVDSKEGRVGRVQLVGS